MNKPYQIIVDAMGGDNAPKAIIEGVMMAMEKEDDFSVFLVGKEEVISPMVSERFSDRITIVNAREEIEMAEPPVEAIRSKKDSSMVVGLTLLKEKKGQAFLTAGSTGATISGATLIVRRAKGVERAALAPVLPTTTGWVQIIDCGANVECKPTQLEQFGMMGSIYMRAVMGLENPRVGLLNNGTEEEKGTPLTKEAYQLLKQSNINFIGNVEARDVMQGACDVVVCDGFSGNILLKGIEGTAKAITAMLKEELMKTTRSKLGALLAKQAFKNLKKRMDYSEYGGALMLGIDGGVIKMHGSSNAKTVMKAVLQAKSFIAEDVVETIKKNIIDYKEQSKVE